MAYTTIGNIVDEYIIEAGYDSRHNYSRLLNIAIRGLKELTYDVSGEPTWAFLELDQNNTSTIPEGVVKILGIYMNSEGGLMEVVEDTNGAPFVVKKDGTTQRPSQVLPSDDTFSLDNTYYNSAKHFQNGQYIGANYEGVESNPYKYIRNYDTNKLEFSSNVVSPVMEYLKNPKLVDGKHIVDEYVAPAILYYLHYADTRFKKNVSPSEKAFNHKNYLAAKNLAARRITAMSRGNFRSAARKGYSLTTK
jgi:hypothetical protein